MKSLAIIGSGIAGLACAYKLQGKCHLTLFEQNDYIGGHSNTIDVRDAEGIIPIDSGFMVFNSTTYPNLNRLFSDLNVPLKSTDMSFSVQRRTLTQKNSFEWCGASLNQLFGQRKNILNGNFWRMLLDLNRFNKCAEEDFDSTKLTGISISQYIKGKGFCDDLLSLYLVPMASAIWSSPPESIQNFPAQTLLRFFHNHGLNNGLGSHLTWLTVDGGAKEYISRMSEHFSGSIKLNKKVSLVYHNSNKVAVKTMDGEVGEFDNVIIAAHANQALSMLAAPSELESNLLSKFDYSSNKVLLHTDQTVMPAQHRCWASWNYRMDETPNGLSHSTHYWMNHLQGLSQKRNYFISLNGDDLVDPQKVLKHINYEHPTFTFESIEAQANLAEINRQYSRHIYFCGSYFRYGFHEDALNSSLELCMSLINNGII